MRWQKAVIIPLFYFLGDADIVLADAGTGQILNKVHVNQKVRKLLSVGKRYMINNFSYPKQNLCIFSIGKQITYAI